ncbi:MAG: hypothetical protein J1F67_09945 [Muribaculaceae bacterium]|nr:hypothetical protein [Muribaculaceae bacterium]
MKLKKLFCLLMFFTLLGSVSTVAQTKIVTGHPDFKIKITRCEANGTTAVIDMLIENVGSKDVKLELRPVDTVAYDDEGDKFSRGKINIRFGDSNLVNGAEGFYVQPSNILPPEIPLKARIQIEGVPETATEFKRIDLGVWCMDWNLGKDKFVKFTNVPISREGDD